MRCDVGGLARRAPASEVAKLSKGLAVEFLTFLTISLVTSHL